MLTDTDVITGLVIVAVCVLWLAVGILALLFGGKR